MAVQSRAGRSSESSICPTEALGLSPLGSLPVSEGQRPLENNSAQFLSGKTDWGGCSNLPAPRGTGYGEPPETPRTQSSRHPHPQTSLLETQTHPLTGVAMTANTRSCCSQPPATPASRCPSPQPGVVRGEPAHPPSYPSCPFQILGAADIHPVPHSTTVHQHAPCV